MSEWIEMPLRSLADIRVSNVDKKAVRGEKPVLLCNYMDVYANDYIHDGLAFMEATASAAEIAKFKVEAGDVILTKDSETPDDIGIPAVVIEHIDNLVCGYHLALLKTKRDLVDPIFLCKQLENTLAQRYFGQRAAGSTRYGLSNGALENTPILLTELPKQQKIAAVLSTIDDAIERTEALIAKYRQIKAGLMRDLFTRGVLPNGQLRPPREQAPDLYRETAIGWIPKEWAVSDCATEFVVDSGITLGPHRQPDKRPHYYLRVANVHRDEIRLDDVAQLELLPHESGSQLREGDLLVVEGHANRLEIGRCAMVGVDAAGLLFQNHLFRLRPKRIEPYFALLWLNSHHAIRHWEVTCSTSSGLNTINRRMLGRLGVLVPSREEQQDIVQIAIGSKSRIDAEVKSLQKLRAQKLGLMQDLLTGKVPVKTKESEPVEAAA